MYVKDGVLYKALYCGLCKSIGAACGQRARFGLSYDTTFLSALLHNIKNTDVKIQNSRCILHPVVKRPMAADDEITRAVACLNTALAYFKLCDDVEDEKKGRMRRSLLHKGMKKADALHPQIGAIIRRRMKELSALEKKKCASLDMAADPFANMMAEISDYCLGEYATEATRGLCYGIGKWVYLIDALDDYDKDVKKGYYNPFYESFGEASRARMLEKNGDEADFVFRSIFASNAENLRNIRFYFNHDLTDNIILRGLPAATQRVRCGCKEKIKPEKARLR